MVKFRALWQTADNLGKGLNWQHSRQSAGRSSQPSWLTLSAWRQTGSLRMMIHSASVTGYSRCYPERGQFSVLHSHTQKEQAMEDSLRGVFRWPTPCMIGGQCSWSRQKKDEARKRRQGGGFTDLLFGRKCALIILRGWVIFPVGGRFSWKLPRSVTKSRQVWGTSCACKNRITFSG